jgi:cell division protein FtsL
VKSEVVMLATQRKTEYRPAPPSKKRIVKMEGNVAYISTGRSRNEALRGRNAAKQKARKPVAAVKAKHTRKGIASTIAVIFIAFCALALLVSRYAAVCTINSENNKLKSEIEAVKVKTEELKVQMELQDDLENVLDTAKNNLGMKYPDQDQRIYLDMS